MIHGNGPTNNPETNALFEELRRDTLENFTLPNDQLHPECVDGRTVKCKSENNRVTSLAVAMRKFNRSKLADPVVSEFEKEKAERARRVQMYSQQMTDTPDGVQPPEGGIDFDVNDNRLYRKQLEFCAAAVRSGTMNFDNE